MMDVGVKKKEKEDEKKYILAKKHAYSLDAKDRYRPTVDPAKQREVEQLINAHKGRQRKHNTPNRVSYSERY